MTSIRFCAQSLQQFIQDDDHTPLEINNVLSDTVTQIKRSQTQEYQKVQNTPRNIQLQKISSQIQLVSKQGDSEKVFKNQGDIKNFSSIFGTNKCQAFIYNSILPVPNIRNSILFQFLFMILSQKLKYLLVYFQQETTNLKQSLVQYKHVLAKGSVGSNFLNSNRSRCAQKYSISLRKQTTASLAEEKRIQLPQPLLEQILKEIYPKLKSKVLRLLNRHVNIKLLLNQRRIIISLPKQLQINKQIQISLNQYKLSSKLLFRQYSLNTPEELVSIIKRQEESSNRDQLNLIKEKTDANIQYQDMIIPNHKPSQFIIKQQNTAQDNTNILKNIHQIIDILKKDNMLALKSYWNYGMHSQLQWIKNNWNIYCNQFQKQMKKIIMILDYKIHRFRLNLQATNKQTIYFCKQNSNYLNLYELLYPGITRLVKQYLKLLQINSFQKNFIEFKKKIFQLSSMKVNYLKIFNQEIMHLLGLQSNRLDEFIVFYVLQLLLCKLNNQNKQLQVQQGEFLQPLKKCFFDYKASKDDQYQVQDLLNSIKTKVQQIKLIKKSINIIKEFQKIQLRRDPVIKCLGCSQFFQFKSNILDQSINETPIKVFPSIKTLKDYDSMLKNQICAMLNSYGGVIFFGCQGQYKTAVALGQKLTQHNKQDSSQILQHILKSIYPKIQYNNEVQLTFVPIIEQTNLQKAQLQAYKGEENMLKLGEFHYSQKYMKGVYMARIRVNPINNYLTYYWERKEGNESRYFSAVLQNSKAKNVKGNQLTKLIKRRFKQNYIPQIQNLTSLQKKNGNNPQSCFDKPCLLPQQGYKIAEIDSVHQCMSQKKEDKYRYMSLMIFKEKYLNDVKQKLSKKIRFFIQQRFRSYGFKSALCTYVLYHDNSFDQLLKLISYSPEFVYEQKMTIVIYISQYLKFKESFSPPTQKLMNKSLLWLKKQFPNQTIRFYSYHTQRGIEYYAQTNTRISTLFMYYFFNDQKVKTFLKSPPKLSELSPQQKNVYWREISYYNANQLEWL